MTYGQIKFRLTKQFPGVDADVIEGYINDRYAEILAEMPWQRQNVESVLITAAPYTTGAVVLTPGSVNVTGVGTGWFSGLDGRGVRPAGRAEFYQFTFIGATAAALDRPYEGTAAAPPTLVNSLTSGSGSMTLTDGGGTSIGEYFLIDSEAVQVTSLDGASFNITRGALGTTPASHTAGATVTPLLAYTIFQHIYPLPADCRLLEDDAFSSKFGPMKRLTHAELNLSDPQRNVTGAPQAWASYMDDNSTPPLMQVEVWPIPDRAIGIPFTYASQVGPLTQTSALLQVWLQPTALIEGATAKIKAFLKDYAGAPIHKADSAAALKLMRNSEAQGMAPARMTLSAHYMQGRLRRGRGH